MNKNMQPPSYFEINDSQGVLMLRGAWVSSALCTLQPQILKFLSTLASKKPTQGWNLNLKHLEDLDLNGAWVVQSLANNLKKSGAHVAIQDGEKRYHLLLKQVDIYQEHPQEDEQNKGESNPRALTRQSCLDDWVIGFYNQLRHYSTYLQDYLEFVGQVIIKSLQNLWNLKSLRVTSIVFHIQESGLKALPIVGLISFLIGVVLVYQGATQLMKFGAQIFTVDLLGISVFREVSPLLTAIVVAGRSGSAFAAQIGAMKLNQEVDAITILGLDATYVLVLPRVFALIIALPLLTFWGDLMGICGGGFMSLITLKLPLSQFFARLNGAISSWVFWAGIIKTPFFAALIAISGCKEGMAVRGGAESIGRHTTRAVVKGIFMVIICDAVFSILFSRLGW